MNDFVLEHCLLQLVELEDAEMRFFSVGINSLKYQCGVFVIFAFHTLRIDKCSL